MFTQKITESDAFLDLEMSSQCLYFHLCMHADDDGFVRNPKRIGRMVGANDDDFKVLLDKAFLLAFPSGVIVVKHWRKHNLIRKDRYVPTDCIEEFKTLYIKDDKTYTLDSTQGVPLSEAVWQPDGNRSGNQPTTTTATQGKNKNNNNNKNNNKDKEKDNDKDNKKNLYSPAIREIIDYLNDVCGTHYLYSTEKTRSLIIARLNESFTVDDFKTVIDKKNLAWHDDPKMCEFLRPQTLFGTKFESYLNETPSARTRGKASLSSDHRYTESELRKLSDDPLAKYYEDK